MTRLKSIIRFYSLAALTMILSAVSVSGCARGKSPATADPVTITVAADGSGQYASIQKAIDKAPAGAIIKIAPGDYIETLRIAKPLTLEGAGPDKTALIPPGIAKDKLAGLVKTMDHQMHFAKTPEERNAVRQKMLEDVFTPPLLVTGATNVTIRAMRLTQLPADKAMMPRGRFAAGFVNASGALDNCAIVGSTVDGVQIVGASDVTLSGCLVAAAWGTGVAVTGLSGAEAPPRARIEDCDIRNNRYAGVTISRAGTGVTIARCRISGSAWHGARYQDGSSPTIEHNAIFRNARFAIYSGGGPTAAQIRHNLFLENEMAGMLLEGESADLIERNTFARNKREALTYLGAKPLHLEGNLFFENADTIAWHVNNERAAKPDEAAKGIPARNAWWPGKSNGARGVYNPRTMAPDSIVEPKFTGAETGDFNLAADWRASWGEAGAAEVPLIQSPWPIQPEEKAIIPPDHTREDAHWTPPVQAWGVQTEE